MKKNFILFLTCIVLLCSFNAVNAADGSGNVFPAVGEKTTTTEKSDKSKDKRFVKISEDNSFIYLLDSKNSGWVRRPYTAGKYIISAWVKMVPYEFSANIADISTDVEDKYYLEHYLIDPQMKKIQFLCEMEVSGRPDNNIQQRKYDPNNWEDLIPDSIEDTIYHAVVKKLGSNKSSGQSGGITDMLEDVFRVAI